MSAPAASLPNGNGSVSPGATTPAPAAASRSTTNKDGSSSLGTFGVKSGLAQMLKVTRIGDTIGVHGAETFLLGRRDYGCDQR